MSESLSALADTDTVDNVVIFVSDALRFDFLPEEVRNLGVTANAIAPSTFTASALPSLLTGQYPAKHGVWMFDNQLVEKPPLLRNDGVSVGFDAEHVWTKLESDHKPPLQIHHLETEAKLHELESPFVHVIHDIGPHAPYGFTNDVFSSTKSFFNEYEKRQDQLIELYRKDCHNSAERFLEVYQELIERDLLEDTLVVFTSDHGQCLGEKRNGGRFGHGHPMSPESVGIPIVFIGAGLPRGMTYPSLLSGTDIAPTVYSAQRGAPFDNADGLDIWRETPDSGRKHRSEVWQHLDVAALGRNFDLTVYAATSLWDDSGGYVFHRGSTVQRAGALVYDNLFRGYSPAWRHNVSPAKLVRFCGLALADDLTFGSPEFSETIARLQTPDEFEQRSHPSTEITLSEDQEAQLRDLGYLQ